MRVGITPNLDLVVSAEEVKSFLRVTHALDDVLIAQLILSAQQTLERYLGRFFLPTQISIWFDRCELESPLTLPYANHIITSITYYDHDSNEHSLTNEDYWTDNAGDVNRIVFTDISAIKSACRANNALVVASTSGYADVDAIPVPLRLAVKQLVAHFYDNREIVTNTTISEIPQTAFDLSYPYRIWTE